MRPILIVEDEPAIADLIEMTLEPLGQPLIKAHTGNEAANLLESTLFDLILLDVMLPGVDGFTLMDYIAPTGTPVIFLTAKATVEDRVRGLRLGAYIYSYATSVEMARTTTSSSPLPRRSCWPGWKACCATPAAGPLHCKLSMPSSTRTTTSSPKTAPA